MEAWGFDDEAGPSDKYRNGSTTKMDLDDDIDLDSSSDEDLDNNPMEGFDESFLKMFCRKSATSFFDKYGLISHQINSYNDFVQHGIQKLFDSIGEISIEPGYDVSKKREGDWRRGSLKFGKVTLEPPMFWTGEKFTRAADGATAELELYPRHARLQNMTYSSRIRVETHLQVYSIGASRSDKFKTGVDQTVEKTILNDYNYVATVGRLPVMVMSELCRMSSVEKRDCEFDHGGYFIIKGAEKTFIAQEQICLKRLSITNDPTWTVAYRSVAKRNRIYIKLSPKTENVLGADKILTVYFYITEIPIWLLFFSLGVAHDREIVKMINIDIEDSAVANILIASIYEADKRFEGFRKDGSARKYIGELMKNCKYPPEESVEQCIERHLFPNLDSPKKKACFLAYMVKCLLEAYRGRRRIDNRDDLKNKRLELAGELLERELRAHMKHAEKRLVKALQRDLDRDRELREIEHYLDAAIITNGLSRAFSTGAWCHPYKRMERVSGVVATIRRNNPLQAISDMRKTRQQVSYTGRVGDARYPHPSHWGKMCFISTPDGENCGLVKNLASMGIVSINMVEREGLVKIFRQCGMEKLADDTSSLLDGRHKIFLDGDWVGLTRDPSSFTAKLRRKRRMMSLLRQLEVKRDEHQKEVRIYVDAGRILRPLLVVQNLKKVKDLKGDFNFDTLLDNGVLEFIGPEEEEDCQTAWGVKYLFTAELDNPPVRYTHCELDSSFLLGLSCGLIPFANHDHARRVLYQAEKHSHQAIGYSTTNPMLRIDTNSHQLYYPQRPLFKTILSDCLGRSRYANHHKGMLPRPEFSNGQCAIVAVNVHLGYNQEDSLVMNRSSLERGMFRTEHVRTYKTEVEYPEQDNPKKKVKLDEVLKFGKMQSKIGRVDSLEDDGFPFVGANLQTGDIVIGKHSDSGIDQSVKLKHTERGMVQKVVLSSNDDGKNFAAVSLRQVRGPCLGDKFSSMHGQKGVLGFLESQENFPFSKEGIVPDIVINPHAFPSRQTPGQLLEAALAKGIALGGALRYATPFSTPSVEDVTAQLHRLGFSRWGDERVYDGRTGEPLRSLIFVGPTFYQRLTHMAEDKVKFRNTGPVHPLTRQPVADRKRFGGIKFGEMERDCLIAHGAAANLHERLVTLSDSSHMHVCRRCTNVAGVVQRTVLGGRKVRGPYCRFCESADSVVRVSVPYGAKLLCQELFSMGISLKFDTELC